MILSDSLCRLEAWPGDGPASLGLSRSEAATLQEHGFIRLDRGSTTVRRVARTLPDSAVPALVVERLTDLDARFPNETPLTVEVWPMDPEDAFGRQRLGLAANAGYDGRMTRVVWPDVAPPVAAAPWMPHGASDSMWNAWWPSFVPHLSAPGDGEMAVRLAFGGREELLRWVGYMVGYLLVQRYRQANPTLSVVDRTALADDVFVP